NGNILLQLHDIALPSIDTVMDVKTLKMKDEYFPKIDHHLNKESYTFIQLEKNEITTVLKYCKAIKKEPILSLVALKDQKSVSFKTKNSEALTFDIDKIMGRS